MNELSKLKSWFFLDDAAKELSRILGEDCTSRGVLQAIFEEHLSLSWNIMAKGVLPAKSPLPKADQPIPDQSLIVPVSGLYKIVLNDNEINMQGIFNIRKEWLNRLMLGKSPVEGMFNTSGFLIEDSEGNFWRPMTFLSGGVSGVFHSDTIGNERTKPVPEGFYPQTEMPDISELIIRKVDLEKLLMKVSPQVNGVQNQRETVIKEYLTKNEESRIKKLTLQQVWSELEEMAPELFKSSKNRTIGDCLTQCRKAGIPFPKLK